MVRIMDMETKNRHFGMFWVFVLLALGLMTGAGGDDLDILGDDPVDSVVEVLPAEGEGKAIAAVISCQGMIDDGLFKSIKRRSEEAVSRGATYLIYEIGTYGGLLQAGDDISKYFILEIGKKVHTVAYITTEAISAGAMISVGCKDIIMLENTTIGDCAPIVMGGKLEGVEREKAESFTRVAFVRAAEANDYPEALLRAMVSQQLEVWQVENLETGKYEYFETKDVPKDEEVYDVENKYLVVKDDEILTLTAKQATEYGIARAQVKDLDEALAFLAERDGVTFADKPIELEMLWSEEMVRWVNSPAVMAVLVMLAMLGAYVEFNTPGLGLPGLVAVIAIVVIVGSKYLIGMANWVEVAIFCVGIILLLIEIFVIPGFGLAGVTGIICILVGMFGMLVKNPPDKIPWPSNPLDWDIFFEGVIILIVGFTGFVVFAWTLAKYLPKIEFLSGLMLRPSGAGAAATMQVSMTAPPEAEAKVKVGNRGKVVSPLRPTGTAQFGAAQVDVVAQAEFLDRDTEVEVIEIHGNRVVVKKI